MQREIRRIVGREKVQEVDELVVVGSVSGEIVFERERDMGEALRKFLAKQEDMAVGILVDNRMWVGVVGNGGAWTKKNETEGWIVPVVAERQVTVLSGEMADGQMVRLEVGENSVEVQMVNTAQGVKIGGWVEKLKNKLPGRNSGTVYLTRGLTREQMRKRVRIGGMAFVGIVAILVVWGQVRLQKQRAQMAAINKKIEQVAADFKEAKDLVDLNPVRSKILADKVETGLNSLDDKAKHDPRLAEVNLGLGQVLGAATGVRAAGMTEVLDLNLVRPDMKGAGLLLADDGLMVVDVEGDRLVTVDPDKKSGSVILGQEALGDITLAAMYPGKIVLVSDKGILQCTINNLQCTIAVETDKEWGKIVDMAMFGGNIYLLDHSAGSGQVWRYPVIEKGYGARQGWLAGGTTLPSDANGMAIDGNIWVAGEGKVYKFAQGAADNFTISGLNKPLGKHLRLMVEQDGDKAYVLDSDNQRLVAIKKDGTYVGQYQDERLGQAVSGVVDEKSNKAYILLPGAVWKIDL